MDDTMFCLGVSISAFMVELWYDNENLFALCGRVEKMNKGWANFIAIPKRSNIQNMSTEVKNA